MKKLSWFVLSLISLWAVAATDAFQFYPGAEYDPSVPTLKEVVGHSWGEQISSHSEMERYVKALAEASPRVQLREYGKTWQGRTLYYLIVASERNMARLEEIRSGSLKLADPRGLNSEQSERLLASLPAIVWLAYGVHGNEISSTDAALLTAYHLAAALNDDLARTALENAVVIINPLQNPDGRDRFVNFFRQTTGRWPDGDPQSAEHNEVWPGGRTNHYLFDMNRDWFARTQPETRGHQDAFLQWYPQVFVDLHEMGSNSTYYFAPPADPVNPVVTRQQWDWLNRFGRNNAKWFDRMNFDYFTREVYDSFYPGYGESWPMFQGSIGMTYEQASVRGLVVDRNDDTRMEYRESAHHHFISSLATIQVAAEYREDLLRYFLNARRSAVESGRNWEVKEYLIDPTPDPVRAARFVALLMAQGIEVRQADAPFTHPRVEDYFGRPERSEDLPAGTYSISLAQPASRLVKTLLDKETPMDSAFVAEQLRRQEKRMRDEIYDLTAWSMPLLFDLKAYMAKEPSPGRFKVLAEVPPPAGGVEGEKAQVAYLVAWSSLASAQALAEMLRQDIRVHSSDKAFTLEGRRFPAGSLIVKVRGNPENLHDRLRQIAAQTGAQIFPANSAWVDEGVNFGSNYVQYVKKPRVAMLYNRPTSPYSAGWARYVLEQTLGYPVTLLPADDLNSVDLVKYDTLIFPDSFGGYGSVINASGVDRVREWVRQGGVLVALGGGATRWLTEEGVELLATKREYRKPARDSKPGESAPPQAGSEEAPSEPSATESPQSGTAQPGSDLEPEREYPPGVAGALVLAEVDPEQWLAFGYERDVPVLVAGSNIYTPLKLDKGRNAARYADKSRLRLSGFLWPESYDQLPGKAYLMNQPHGRGHVVAFAEDPNYRGFMTGLQLLFVNAVFFGPAH